jgi:hypothetical protein
MTQLVETIVKRFEPDEFNLFQVLEPVREIGRSQSRRGRRDGEQAHFIGIVNFVVEDDAEPGHQQEGKEKVPSKG